MSKRKKETVGKIIARILPIKVPEELSDEDAAQFVAQLLGRYDAETVAHLEGVINDLWRGIPPNPDDCRILAGIAETCVLLKRRGGSNKKSQETRAADEARREQVNREGRVYYAKHRRDGHDPDEAMSRTIRDLRTKFPHGCGQLANSTIKSRVRRLHKSAK